MLVDEFASRYGFKPQPWNHSIVLSRRPEDGTYRQFTPSLTEKRPLLSGLIKFIKQSSKLPAQHFTEHSAAEISKFLKYGRAVMFFYYDPLVNNTQAELIADFAQKNYRRMLARFVEPTNSLGIEYLENVGFTPELGKIYMITKRVDKLYHKYILNPKTRITKANVKEFLDDCLDGTYKEFFMSEQPPTQAVFDGLITLVGKTINQLVFQEKDYYHIVFLVDRNTAQAVQKFHKMAKSFTNQKARFYIFDTERNEHRLIDPEHEGNILVFSKRLQVKRIFKLDSQFNMKGFGDFLSKSLRGDKDFVKQVKQMDIWQDL